MATAGKAPASRPPPAELSSSARPFNSAHFSSGNPRIEETRGVVLPPPRRPNPPAASSSSDLPVTTGRKPQVCMLAVPNHMTYTDFCLFCGAFVPHKLDMRIINDNFVKNHEMQKENIRKVAREKAAIKLKDEKIQNLEEELRDLIAHFECQKAIVQAHEWISSDIQGGNDFLKQW